MQSKENMENNELCTVKDRETMEAANEYLKKGSRLCIDISYPYGKFETSASELGGYEHIDDRGAGSRQSPSSAFHQTHLL